MRLSREERNDPRLKLKEPIRKAECGECAQCCKTMGIVEIEKMPGKWCPHAKPGKCNAGCGIYETRPEECKTFSCIWLQSQSTIPGLPMKLRPDKSKVVLTVNETTAGGTAMLAHLTRDQPVAYREEPMWAYLKECSGKLPTFIILGDSVRRVFPNGEIQDAPNAIAGRDVAMPIDESRVEFVEPEKVSRR